MERKRTHSWIDERSLELARAVAAKLRADPSLYEIAGRNLRRWKATLSEWPGALEEWELILARCTREEILEALLDPSDAGCRRRQSSPFTGILTPGERKAIFARHEKTGS